MDLLNKFVIKSDMILDLSAEDGQDSVYFASLNSNANIYSFEKNPSLCEKIQSNLFLHTIKNVTILNNEIGEKLDTRNGILSLDSLNLQSCDFIKLSREESLLGAFQTLDKYKPVLYYKNIEPKMEFVIQHYQIQKMEDNYLLVPKILTPLN